jgi:hypothetical protein
MQYWPSKGAAVITDFSLRWLPALSQLALFEDAIPTIEDSDWSVLSGDVNISGGVFTDTTTSIRLGQGTADSEAVLRNTVTLNSGEAYYEDVFIKVRA